MTGIGVGENAKPTAAQQAVMDLLGSQEHNVKVIQHAINTETAILQEQIRRSEAEATLAIGATALKLAEAEAALAEARRVIADREAKLDALERDLDLLMARAQSVSHEYAKESAPPAEPAG